MKMTLMPTVAIVCFVAAHASAELVESHLVTTADSYINSATLNQDSNYGNLQNIKLTNNRPTGEFGKGYILFDASHIDPADIVKVDAIGFYYSRGVTRDFGVWMLWKNDGNDDNWTELGITWNNAPYNDGTPNRSFNPKGALGENVQDFGTFTATKDSPGYYKLVFDDAEQAMVLNALKTGDRKVTFGLSMDTSNQDGQVWSRENDGNPPFGNPSVLRMYTIPEPTTLVLLCLGLGSVALVRKRKGHCCR